MATETVRGCTIEFERSGSGIDLVWGHGLTQSRALEDRRTMIDWSMVPARVVRYDARGHGGSDSTVELDGYSWAELARDQLELASSLGIDAYVSAGASMGAATALHAAVIAPERIRGLVLVIPPTAWEARSGQAEVYEKGAQAVEAVGVDPLIAAGALVAPPDPFLDDPEFHATRTAGLRTWDPTRLAQAMRGATRAQLPDREQISSIDCPTLILAWTGDPVHPVATTDELATLIPHAEVHIASTASDLKAWSERLTDFVATLTAPTDTA